MRRLLTPLVTILDSYQTWQKHMDNYAKLKKGKEKRRGFSKNSRRLHLLLYSFFMMSSHTMPHFCFSGMIMFGFIIKMELQSQVGNASRNR